MNIYHLFYLSIVTICLILLYQDFKYRGVDWRLLILLYCICLGINIHEILLNLRDVLFNSIFLLVISVVFVVFLALKERKIINPLHGYVGLGDVLFLLAITPVFYVKNFVAFILIGSLSTLFASLFITDFSTRGIPFAGCLSLLFCILLTIDSIFHLNLLFYGS